MIKLLPSTISGNKKRGCLLQTSRHLLLQTFFHWPWINVTKGKTQCNTKSDNDILGIQLNPAWVPCIHDEDLPCSEPVFPACHPAPTKLQSVYFISDSVIENFGLFLSEGVREKGEPCLVLFGKKKIYHATITEYHFWRDMRRHKISSKSFLFFSNRCTNLKPLKNSPFTSVFSHKCERNGEFTFRQIPSSTQKFRIRQRK